MTVKQAKPTPKSPPRKNKPLPRTKAAKPAPARRAKPELAIPATLTGKQAQLVDLIQRPTGASLAELVAATGWQPHSVRGALCTLRKQRGVPITLSDTSESPRVYRIAP